MLLVPGATRPPRVESSSRQVCSCSGKHLCVDLVPDSRSASLNCSCSLSPGSIEERTRTLILINSIAYARLKIVTKNVTNSQISVPLGSDVVFFAPAFEHYSTDGERVKKELWHSERSCKQAGTLNVSNGCVSAKQKPGRSHPNWL